MACLSSILPNQNGADLTASHGKFEVLKWLATLQPPILPTEVGAIWAPQKGHLEIINQFYQLKLELGASHGHLEVLKWLATLQTPILPTEYGAKLAALSGHLEVVHWLASKGIYPN